MVSTFALYLALLGAIAVERVVELVVSRRNASLAFARGGIEYGARHFPVMAATHTLFLISCALEPLLLDRAFPGLLGFAALVIVIAAQGLRWWAALTLGERWNVRIIVVPGDAPVDGGPYRYMRHPNYLAVIAELIALPLVHGAYATALVFSLANLALLAVRIPAEEQALGDPYAKQFDTRARFVPGRSRS